MAKKFAFIGAGSFGFTRKLVKDILTFPAFRDAEIALMDINPTRLIWIKQACEKIVRAGGYPAKVTATRNRKEALKNADGVLCTILAGDVDVWKHDLFIPKKYGVDINVGDTRGPAGIFRALRTIPVLLEICADIKKYCPKAVFLNYTNPMPMNCRAMQGEYPELTITGLCHSVQGTVEELAKMIGAKNEEITYLCAGVNHQSWYLKFERNGKDAYPDIRKALKIKKNYLADVVRNEMFEYLDYYVTESSGHNSEYNAWFRKRPDLIKKYCIGTSWNPGKYAESVRWYYDAKKTWKKQIIEWLKKPEVDLKRGHEYASYIFNAIFGDNNIFEFNGNVRNTGLIENLPEGCCVEVPVEASRNGLRPMHVGKLPDHLAIINNTTARCEELAVQAAIEGNPRKVFHAIAMDPLTSAVLSLDEIHDMVEEMLKKNKAWLPQFKHSK